MLFFLVTLSGSSSHISKEMQQREGKRQTELSKLTVIIYNFLFNIKKKIRVERRLSDRLRIHDVFLMVSTVLG